MYWPHHELLKIMNIFERFRIASKLDKENAASQVNALIYSMLDEADDILAPLKLTDEEGASYITVKGIK